MLSIRHKSVSLRFTLCIITFIFGFLFFSHSCFAANNNQKIPDSELNMFSQNDIMFYNPFECISRGGSNSCFKINNSTGAQDFWYAEGCLNNGTCTSGVYAPTAYTSHGRNEFLLSDTETDEEFGGMQYIYAENYDIEYGGYDGWIAKFTKNGSNSTKKYYWIVLPDQAYSTGFGETYVATFENLSEPVYFITYDVHACQHQSEDYCGKAKSDPDGVQIGKEFLGAITKNGGDYNEISKIVGKLTSLCRINGQGEVTAKENASGGGTTSQSNSSVVTDNSATSKLPSGKDITWIGDSYSCGALSIIKEKFSGISFGGSECDSKSYIMSNKGVSDRYGGGTENPPALTILKQVAEAGKLKSYLVMAIGTNAGWTDKEVDQFEDIMSSHQDTKVVFVNVKAKAHLMADDNGTNERLKALANSNENYYLADWVAVYDDKYFADNSTHPTANGGYEKWVGVIADTLASINNCTTHEGDYPQYYQANYEKSDHENSDQDWTEIPYGNGNVASSGCGPTSMAMLTTVATGQDVYPQDIIDITKATGSYTTSSPTTLDPLVGEKYGFEVEAVSYSDLNDAENKMREYLQKGYMLHFSGAGGRPFSSGGHYVGIFKIDDDDTVLVANSAFGGNSEMKLHDVVHAGLHYDFTAIKGSGGSGSCGGYCDADPNNSVGEEGLTIDQAKQFMMNYGENKNNSSKEAVGDSMWNMCNGGGSNCVTFSAFFMVKFAGIPASGRWGDGQQVVDNLKARGSVDATFGTEPRVYAIISTPKQHTAVVLGHHDGKWILGHASCSYNGKGKGNGGNGDINNGKGGGSGFIAIEDSDDPVDWQWVNSGYSFAYPDNVDTTKIAEYLTNGV